MNQFSAPLHAYRQIAEKTIEAKNEASPNLITRGCSFNDLKIVLWVFLSAMSKITNDDMAPDSMTPVTVKPWCKNVKVRQVCNTPCDTDIVQYSFALSCMRQ
jgi:hypothetical protein